MAIQASSAIARLKVVQPGEGRTVTVTRDQWLNDHSQLGGWDKPWAIVVPRR